jgi:hypothetical protein
VGNEALFQNSTGDQNTAVGNFSLWRNIAGNDNTGVGANALHSNTFGINNTALGFQSLNNNSMGNFNTAIGHQALSSNTSGTDNNALGINSLISNSTGDRNVAIGSNALYWNQNSYNTAVGFQTLGGTTNSQFNTAIGYTAGGNFDLGYNNTFLGANTNTNASGLFNVIAIGQGVICTASSQARIGNAATNSIGGQVGWTTLSDERMKTNINENVKGLEFIKLLRPVTYNIDANKVDEWFKKDQSQKTKDVSAESNSVMQRGRDEKTKIVFSGFLAQDVEKASKAIGYDFSGIDAPKNDKDLYGLRYADFVVPLVKAVQEQQAIIEKQQKQIDALVQELKMIKEKLK